MGSLRYRALRFLYLPEIAFNRACEDVLTRTGWAIDAHPWRVDILARWDSRPFGFITLPEKFPVLAIHVRDGAEIAKQQKLTVVIIHQNAHVLPDVAEAAHSARMLVVHERDLPGLGTRLREEAARAAYLKSRLVAAVRDQQWEEAMQFSAALAAENELDPGAILATANALRGLQCHQDAATLLAVAHDHYRDDNGILLMLAWVSIDLRNWEQAVRYWHDVTIRLPSDPGHLRVLAMALRNAGRIEDAELVLSEAIKRFPEAGAIAVEYAWNMSRAGHWPEAVRRWRCACAAVRDDPSPVRGLAMSLRQIGDFASAELVITDGLCRFPKDISLLIDHAWTANRNGHWPEAARRWHFLSELRPDDATFYINEVCALREAGHLAEAEACFTDAVSKFPENGQIQAEGGRLASRRHDWIAAADRFRRAIVLNYDDRQTEESFAFALAQTRACEAAEWRSREAG